MPIPREHRSDFVKIFAALAVSAAAGGGVDAALRPFDHSAFPGLALAVALWLGLAFLLSMGLVFALGGGKRD